MPHELWLLKGAAMTNITPLIGILNWRSNKDELGEEINFNIAFNDAKHFPKNPCELGDVVILKNKSELNRFVLVEENRNGRGPISYIGFDYAFYLNKSDAIYQFNKVSAEQAIQKICKDFGIPIGKIDSMPTKIDRLFDKEKVSDIIRQIIDLVRRKTGTKYLLEMRKGKLYIEKQSNLIVKGSFNMYTNGPSYDITSAISNPSRSRSISDMINTIQVVGNNDKVVLVKSDAKMVDKYGKLQKVVTLDQNEKLSAARIAQNELNALSKIVEETSVELLGDDRVRANRMLELEEPITGIKGTLLIKDAEHTVSGGIHKMKLNLEVV